MNPVWPNEPIGSSSPRFAEKLESMSQPSAAHVASSAAGTGVVIFATVSGDSTRVAAIAAAVEQHPAEDREVGGRAEQPGVPGDAAHPPRGRIVDDAAQHRHARARRTASRTACSSRSARSAPRSVGRRVEHRVVHPERLEDPLLRELVERLAADAARRCRRAGRN